MTNSSKGINSTKAGKPVKPFEGLIHRQTIISSETKGCQDSRVQPTSQGRQPHPLKEKQLTSDVYVQNLVSISTTNLTLSHTKNSRLLKFQYVTLEFRSDHQLYSILYCQANRFSKQR